MALKRAWTDRLTLCAAIAALWQASPVSAGTITAQGAVTALTNVSQMGAIGVRGGNFDEGPTSGNIPLGVYSNLGLTYYVGPLTGALPGVTTPGTELANPEYSTTIASFLFHNLGGGGTVSGAYCVDCSVAVFSVPVTRVGLVAADNGTQYLTAWDTSGTMIGQVTWTPNNDAAFVGLQSTVPLGMVTYGNHDLWSGQAFDVSGATPISDSWMWAGCGDTVIGPGEQCDDGNLDDGDACRNNCQLPVCGDGAIHVGFEQCDDGNTVNGDCCSSTCTIEPSGTPCRPVAGPCDAPEACDGASPVCPADGFLPAITTCRLAAGVCDLTEHCTGSAAACPPDAKSTAVCRPAAQVCDAAESCDGVGNDCPPDAALPDGASCSDGLFCNGAERCQGGTCQPGSPPCLVPCDENADDCIAACPPTAAACRSAQKSMVSIADKDDDTKDKLMWKWIKGASTTQPEMGDPKNSADYVLCLYAGTTQSLIAGGETIVPPNASKWNPIADKGWKYDDADGTADGVQKIILKGSDQSKSKALLKGAGTSLSDPTLPIASTDLPLIVQLFNTDKPVCLESVFGPGEVIKNTASQFKAKAQ